jgi:hypothetical protein
VAEVKNEDRGVKAAWMRLKRMLRSRPLERLTDEKSEDQKKG